MIQVLQRPETEKERFSKALNESGPKFAEVFSRMQQPGLERKENEAISKLIGQNISGIQDPKIRQEVVGNMLKGQGDIQKKMPQYQAGLETIAEMKRLREKGNLGRGSAITGFFGGETARDRGKYEQLGKSLIQLSTTIPIRNKLEFETLAEKLYDPSIPDAQADGILEAMEQIIRGSMGIGSMQMGMQQQSQQKERPPLSSFHG